VLACSADGGQVVVKLTPTPEEARLEAAALPSWAHTGTAVRLIDADISENILDPGRADDLGGERAVSRATFAFPLRRTFALLRRTPGRGTPARS
jgi:hypothetical protein